MSQLEGIGVKKLKSAWEKFEQTKFCRTLKEYAGLDDLIAIIITIIGALFYCKNGFIPYHEGWHAFYERIHVELIGIGITVLILGNADQTIRIKQEKHRLILQMGSPDNSFAREAVRQLKARGWLCDGTLKGAYLMRADLSKSNLTGAKLNGIILCEANLEQSVLSGSHLENAFLSGASIKEAYLLGANLQGTNLVGAHLEDAHLQNVYFNDETVWSTAYYNTNTKWPEGFDPVAAGCILVENE